MAFDGELGDTPTEPGNVATPVAPGTDSIPTVQVQPLYRDVAQAQPRTDQQAPETQQTSSTGHAEAPNRPPVSFDQSITNLRPSSGLTANNNKGSTAGGFEPSAGLAHGIQTSPSAAVHRPSIQRSDRSQSLLATRGCQPNTVDLVDDGSSPAVTSMKTDKQSPSLNTVPPVIRISGNKGRNFKSSKRQSSSLRHGLPSESSLKMQNRMTQHEDESATKISHYERRVQCPYEGSNAMNTSTTGQGRKALARDSRRDGNDPDTPLKDRLQPRSSHFAHNWNRTEESQEATTAYISKPRSIQVTVRQNLKPKSSLKVADNIRTNDAQPAALRKQSKPQKGGASTIETIPTQRARPKRPEVPRAANTGEVKTMRPPGSIVNTNNESGDSVRVNTTNTRRRHERQSLIEDDNNSRDVQSPSIVHVRQAAMSKKAENVAQSKATKADPTCEAIVTESIAAQLYPILPESAASPTLLEAIAMSLKTGDLSQGTKTQAVSSQSPRRSEQRQSPAEQGTQTGIVDDNGDMYDKSYPDPLLRRMIRVVAMQNRKPKKRRHVRSPDTLAIDVHDGIHGGDPSSSSVIPSPEVIPSAQQVTSSKHTRSDLENSGRAPLLAQRNTEDSTAMQMQEDLEDLLGGRSSTRPLKINHNPLGRHVFYPKRNGDLGSQTPQPGDQDPKVCSLASIHGRGTPPQDSQSTIPIDPSP